MVGIKHKHKSELAGIPLREKGDTNRETQAGVEVPPEARSEERNRHHSSQSSGGERRKESARERCARLNCTRYDVLLEAGMDIKSVWMWG